MPGVRECAASTPAGSKRRRQKAHVNARGCEARRQARVNEEQDINQGERNETRRQRTTQNNRAKRYNAAPKGKQKRGVVVAANVHPNANEMLRRQTSWQRVGIQRNGDCSETGNERQREAGIRASLNANANKTQTGARSSAMSVKHGGGTNDG